MLCKPIQMFKVGWITVSFQHHIIQVKPLTVTSGLKLRLPLHHLPIMVSTWFSGRRLVTGDRWPRTETLWPQNIESMFLVTCNGFLAWLDLGWEVYISEAHKDPCLQNEHFLIRHEITGLFQHLLMNNNKIIFIFILQFYWWNTGGVLKW